MLRLCIDTKRIHILTTIVKKEFLFSSYSSYFPFDKYMHQLCSYFDTQQAQYDN